MKSGYRKLGEFIQAVDIRNGDLSITHLLGVSVEKHFIESIANTIGTDFSKYKIVRKGQFTYIPDTSRRGDKIAIALLKDFDEGLVSNIYTVFEVTDTNKLLPEYLMLWFSRAEFDRYARYKSQGSVREIFDWEEMCNVELPVPALPEQQKIVNTYNAIERRIQIKRKINEKLEEVIINLYRKYNYDEPNPKKVKISDLGNIVSGATPSTTNEEYFTKNGIHWLTPKDITSKKYKFISRGEIDITEKGYNSCSTKILPKGSILLTSRAPVGEVAIALNEVCTNQGFKSIIPFSDSYKTFIYCFLKENKQLLINNSIGTTFLEISGEVLKNIELTIPSDDKISKLDKICETMFDKQLLNEQEIQSLQKLQQLLVSRIAEKI